MGANAQTTVPTFTAGQVLTAAQQNNSARTGVPVFAGTTERDAAFGGAGEKTLAEGQLCYLESTNVVQYYDGAAWATVGPAAAAGLELITAQNIGTAVSSVAVTNCFSATYDTYRVIISGGGVSNNDAELRLQLGSLTTLYYSGQFGTDFTSGAFAGRGINNAANFSFAGFVNTASIKLNVDIVDPFLASRTFISSFNNFIFANNAFAMLVGEQRSSTSCTGFSVFPSSGTLTGGTIRVYGYKN